MHSCGRRCCREVRLRGPENSSVLGSTGASLGPARQPQSINQAPMRSQWHREMFPEAGDDGEMDCGRNCGWHRWTYRRNLRPGRHRREAARLADSSREHCGYLKGLLRRFCDQLLMQKEDERRWVEGDGALRSRVRKALRKGTLGPVSGCDFSRCIP